MAAKKHYSLLTLLLIIVLCANMVSVQPVRADGETPTEPPVATEVVTEEPVQATPEPVETAQVEETPVPVETISTEESVEPTLTEETPVPVESTPTAEPVQETPTPEPVMSEHASAVIQLPPSLEETDIVVLDEEGEAVVLGSQDAANALVSSDPVWCPDSVGVPTPGANGCSPSYSSIAALLAAMQSNPQSFASNGTIFLQATQGNSFTTSLILDDSSQSLGAAYTSLSAYNLTIQGGWSSSNGSTSGQTVFDGPNAFVQIGSLSNPWAGSVTINNLAIINVTSPNQAPLSVSSDGRVEMNNVSVVGSGVGQDGIQVTASDVDLTNVRATYADRNGISITASEAGTVTLNQVFAAHNGGSGVLIQGADTLVNVSGGNFTDNVRYGIEAWNSISSSLPGGNLWTDQDDYSPGSVVTISGNDNLLNGELLGFTPGETVTVSVQGPNGYTANCVGVADELGSWSCQVTLWSSELAVGNYTYTATGLTSGIALTNTFTDARVINSVLLNGGITVTVGPNGTITVTITVTTTGTNSNTGDSSRWWSTGWRIGSSGPFTCINHANHDTAGTYTETFTITAPANAGSYRISLFAYQNDTCDRNASTIYRVNNGVTVINDPSPPVITPSVSGTLGSNGWYTSNVNVSWAISDPQTGIVSSSGCGPTTLTSETSGTTLTCSATNGIGVSNSGSVTIKIDRTPPSLNLPSDITAEATSSAGADVSYSALANDNMGGSISANCLPASGSTFPINTTTVNCSATDGAGHTASGSFQVTVQDTTPPSLTLPGTITVNATGPSGADVVYTAIAEDSVDGPLPVNCVPVSGSVFLLGTTTVNCDATDTRGNTATGSFIVNVFDPEAPNIILPADIVAEATSAAGAEVTFTVSATDDIDTFVPVTCVPDSGFTFPIGTTTVACTASDDSGNVQNAAFPVTVRDTTPPDILAKANIAVETSSSSGAVVDYVSPGTLDLVDGPGTAACSPISGLLFPVGNTTVTCTASDSRGNKGTSSFVITVRYEEPETPKPPTPPTPPVTTPVPPIIPLTPIASDVIIIPATGGSLIDLSCGSVLLAFTVRLTFFNLCDQQTTLAGVPERSLPAPLPDGFTFVTGLDVDVLNRGQSYTALPIGAGVQMDFPAEEPGEYAVLHWDESAGQWIEVSQELAIADLFSALTGSSGDELYRLTSDVSTLFQILTTEKTGTFILVRK